MNYLRIYKTLTRFTKILVIDNKREPLNMDRSSLERRDEIPDEPRGTFYRTNDGPMNDERRYSDSSNGERPRFDNFNREARRDIEDRRDDRDEGDRGSYRMERDSREYDYAREGNMPRRTYMDRQEPRLVNSHAPMRAPQSFQSVGGMANRFEGNSQRVSSYVYGRGGYDGRDRDRGINRTRDRDNSREIDRNRSRYDMRDSYGGRDRYEERTSYRDAGRYGDRDSRHHNDVYQTRETSYFGGPSRREDFSRFKSFKRERSSRRENLEEKNKIQENYNDQEER